VRRFILKICFYFFKKTKNIFLSLILLPQIITNAKLHHSYFYICFNTVLQLFNFPKITSLLPEPDNASPLVYENTPSFITLPITVKLQDIENQTNLLLNGLIYQDNNIDDDDIEIKV
jgi:hypothetical protein